jgi:hypothetical protein
MPHRRKQAKQQVGQPEIGQRTIIINKIKVKIMSIVAEPYQEIKGLFPQGKIILWDGRMLDYLIPSNN